MRTGRYALLLVLAVFVIALVLIESFDTLTGQQTISEEAQHFFSVVGPQITLLAGIVIGWFGAHFTSTWRAR